MIALFYFVGSENPCIYSVPNRKQSYAIDYVIRHRCDLPKPEIDELFPKNYPDYNYYEGSLVDKINQHIEI